MPPLRIGGALNQTQRGGADRDNPAALFARIIQRLGGRRIEAAPFGVHDVIVGVLDLYGQEGAGADVQRHPMQARPRRLYALNQLGCEMQPGRRRCDGAGFVGENGLVVLRSAGPAGRLAAM